MSARPELLRFAMEGERVRRASATLEAASPHLASALRRAMPFLARRGGQVALCFARAVPVVDLLADIARPFHATRLVSSRGDAGALVLDAGAIAITLDGILGGDGRSPPKLDSALLTGPQTALIAGVVEGIVKSLSEEFARRFGMTLEARVADGDSEDPQGAPMACTFEVGEGAQVGRIMLLLAKEGLLAGKSGPALLEAPLDARVARVVEQVEVDLVAELARQRIALGALSALKVGDQIRLSVPVDGAVDVRADGKVVLRGRPISSGGQIAIRIDGGTARERAR